LRTAAKCLSKIRRSDSEGAPRHLRHDPRWTGTQTDDQRLSDETLASWEKSWGAQTGRLEMANGDGKPWTKQEKEAGADGTRALTEVEPAPQTLYYRPGVGKKDPVLIRVQLQYATRPPVKRR